MIEHIKSLEFKPGCSYIVVIDCTQIDLDGLTPMDIQTDCPILFVPVVPKADGSIDKSCIQIESLDAIKKFVEEVENELGPIRP